MSTITSSIAGLVLTWFIYLFYGAIWRLYFSPISRFPGPKIAAVTLWYELYYDLVKGGQYLFKIEELHKKYGPIIRINPWELHVNDPDFYDEIYAGGGKKRDKWDFNARQFGNPDAAQTTIPHAHHRLRRAPMNKFFSKGGITHFEPFIQNVIDKFISRLREFRNEKKPVRISSAYGCVTFDIISEYSFATNSDQVTKAKDLHADVHDTFINAAAAGTVLRLIPWIFPIMKKVPRGLVGVMNPGVGALLGIQDEMEIKIKSIIDSKKGVENGQKLAHPTIFHDILESDLPPREKTLDRLSQEGQVILGGGTETTAWTLSVATFHILSHSEIRSKLLEELKPVFDRTGGKPKLNDLEQLSYLKAVVSEGLRLSFGVAAHLPRISPDQALVYGDLVIPPGVPISMTSVLIHLNPTIFPSPHTFNPNRWLENPKLSKYLVSFNRGSRQCLGMNLAYAELYLVLSYTLVNFPDMELWETSARDVEIVADWFLPRSSRNGVGVLMG